MKATAHHLGEIVQHTLPLLQNITEEKASLQPMPDKWSPKELIGHLIDSASNNQQKFVRTMQQDGVSFPNYEQDHWVCLQHYNEASWQRLLLLWEQMNLHLAYVMDHIPANANDNKINIGSSGSFTLEFIVTDYCEHLKHHLRSLYPEDVFFRNSFKMVY